MARNYEEVIRSLLVKAYSLEENDPEREALESRALQMMDTHSIEVALNQNSGDTQIRERFTFSNPFSLQKRLLYAAIASHFNSQIIRDSNGVVHFFGYSSDYQSTEFLYTILINQAFEQLIKLKVPSGVNSKSYKTSWLVGFVVKINIRLKESRKKATETAVPGAALVLMDRAIITEQEVNKAFPRTHVNKVLARNAQGYYAGEEAGDNASFADETSLADNGRLQLN